MTAISTNPALSAAGSVPGGADRAQLAKAAKDFEAIFVRQMLASARKASADMGGDELFGSDAADTFRDMQDSRLADTMAQTGALGLAKQIEAHLARFVGSDAGAGADRGAKG